MRDECTLFASVGGVQQASAAVAAASLHGAIAAPLLHLCCTFCVSPVPRRYSTPLQMYRVVVVNSYRLSYPLAGDMGL